MQVTQFENNDEQIEHPPDEVIPCPAAHSVQELGRTLLQLRQLAYNELQGVHEPDDEIPIPVGHSVQTDLADRLQVTH